MEAEDVVHEERNAGGERVEAPRVGEQRHSQRPHGPGRQDRPPRDRRPGLGGVRGTGHPRPVLALVGRYSWVNRGRVVDEKEPGSGKEAAGRAEHVEHGRPAAGEAVVAENPGRHHRDDHSGVGAEMYHRDDHGAARGRRPAGKQRLQGGKQHTCTEPGHDSKQEESGEVDTGGGGHQQGDDGRHQDGAAEQPLAAVAISHPAAWDLQTHQS